MLPAVGGALANISADGTPSGVLAGRIPTGVGSLDEIPLGQNLFFDTSAGTINASGSSTEGAWDFSTNTTMADPGDGRVRANAATGAATSQIAIAIISKNGYDRRPILAAVKSGDTLTATSQTDSTHWVRHRVSGTPTDNSTWFLIPVTFNSAGGAPPSNNETLVINFGQTGSVPSTPPGGSSGELQYNNLGAFGGAAWSAIATSGDLFKATSGATTDKPIVVIAHASQSATAPLINVRTSGGTSILSLIGGTTTETLLEIGVPSGAGGPSGVRLAADGSNRWTFFTSGATSYAFNLSRFGGSEGFTCSTGGLFTINDTLCMPQRTGDPAGVSNSAHIYVKDVAGTAEVFVRDEGGTVTQISPHAADGPADLYAETPGVEHVYRSVSESRGEVEFLNLSRLARAVERLTGEKLRHVETVAEYDARRAT